MAEVERIAELLRRALEGDAWHGPSMAELVADVDAKMAAQHPIASAHSIGEIVLHAAAWQCVVHDRACGKGPITLSPEQDWPAFAGKSAPEWTAAKKELARSGKALRQAILKLGDERLDELPKGGTNTFHVLFHGAIQHTLYHAGQIAILKKGLAGRT